MSGCFTIFKRRNKGLGKKEIYLATELLKVEVIKSHGCTKFSRICAELILLSAKLVKQSDKVLKIYLF